MTKLKCDVIHCASNNDHRCCRPEIQVDGQHAQDSCDTCCASFSAIVGDGAKNAVDYSCPNCQIPIACTAETCKYNHNGACRAETVNMSSCNAKRQSETACATFTCR